jgi:hypothetical protein
MLFNLVRKDTLNWFTTKFLANFRNNSSDFVICCGLLDCSLSSHHSIVSSQNNVCFTTSYLCVTYDNSDCRIRSKSVNVRANSAKHDNLRLIGDLHFCNISIFKSRRLINQRRVVTHDVVDWDAARERDSSFKFLCLFALENLLHLCLNICIHSLADSVNVSAVHTEGDCLFECL